MIEKPGAVDTLEEVLSVKGVDMVQWGGSDYSLPRIFQPCMSAA